MSHKSHPLAFRVGVIEDWRSQWFSARHYRKYLEQDTKIRAFIKENLKEAAIDRVEITRSRGSVRVRIATARPGLIIGRKGAQIRELEQKLRELYLATERKYERTVNPATLELKIDIEEIKEMELFGQVVVEDIVSQLQKRIQARRALKMTLEKVRRNPKVKGVKIKLSGRLNGAEIARQDWLSDGQIPLQTLRAKISYGQATAHLPYGTIGVKVWIYLGETFERPLPPAEEPPKPRLARRRP